MLQRQDITFPTLDGIQLAGTLYLAEGTNEPTPGVVMAPGVSPCFPYEASILSSGQSRMKCGAL